MSPRRSKRLRKLSGIPSKPEVKKIPNKIEDDIEPVAASSPKHHQLDPEDEKVIKTARENLEAIKKEISRYFRLVKFKLGNDFLKQPFSKMTFAKIAFESQQRVKADTNTTFNTVSGLSSISFANLASSTRKSINRLNEKNASFKTRNQKLEHSRFSSKDISMNRSINRTFDLPKSLASGSDSLKTSDSRSNRSSSSKSGRKASRKLGQRVVACVTPGPDFNRAMSVLRRPTAGELAVSLYGSPLLVAPDLAPTALPQINLPTADGKVVSILPKGVFTVDDMPHLTTPTRHQLKILNGYLNDLCQED